LKEPALTEAVTLLIAVGDGVLADSLRFSLELEGFEVKLCDGYSLLRAANAKELPGCLVLDHDMFLRMGDGNASYRRLAERGVPIVLMVGELNERVFARAMQAGVTEVVEKPLFGGVLPDAIRAALKEHRPSWPVHQP
jgi:FixJ family two-component response regulator